MRNIATAVMLSLFVLLLMNGCQGGVARKPVVIEAPEQEEKIEEKKVEDVAGRTGEELTEAEIDDAFGVTGESQQIRLLRRRLEFYQEESRYWQKFAEKLEGLDLEFDGLGEWRKCGTFYQDMIAEYRDILLQDKQREEGGLSGNQDPWSILAQDFGYLRGNKAVSEPFSGEYGDGPTSKECEKFMVDGVSAAMEYHAARRQYEEEIGLYDFLKTYLKGRQITDELKESYGRALIEQGRLQEGLEILMEILAGNGRQQVDSLTLRRETVGYLIALGDFDRARLQMEQIKQISRFCSDLGRMGKDYEELLEKSSEYELKLYGNALYSWLVSSRREIPATLRNNVAELKRQAPQSEAAKLTVTLLEQAEKRVEKYVYRELSRAVELVKSNDFRQAFDIVDHLSRSSLPPEVMQKVRATETAIRKKQTLDESRQKELEEEALEVRWEKAMNQLDRKEYDQALAGFRSLLDTEYRKQAKGKIREAIRLAAAAKRQKAAELFIKARGAAGDVEKKVDFLQQSRRLLLEIQNKYPEAAIIDKVKQNLDVVEAALSEIDPLLLEKDNEDGVEFSTERPSGGSPDLFE